MPHSHHLYCSGRNGYLLRAGTTIHFADKRHEATVKGSAVYSLHPKEEFASASIDVTQPLVVD
jgi:hypothetical protein